MISFILWLILNFRDLCLMFCTLLNSFVPNDLVVSNGSFLSNDLVVSNGSFASNHMVVCKAGFVCL